MKRRLKQAHETGQTGVLITSHSLPGFPLYFHLLSGLCHLLLFFFKHSLIHIGMDIVPLTKTK